jgi:hypothetical protein
MVLRRIVDAPWYYRNDHLHRDLKIPTIRQEIQKLAKARERAPQPCKYRSIAASGQHQREQKAQEGRTV